jgi:hypothetical protein
MGDGARATSPAGVEDKGDAGLDPEGAAEIGALRVSGEVCAPFATDVEVLSAGTVTGETCRDGGWSDTCVDAMDDREVDRDFVRR